MTQLRTYAADIQARSDRLVVGINHNEAFPPSGGRSKLWIRVRQELDNMRTKGLSGNWITVHIAPANTVEDADARINSLRGAVYNWANGWELQKDGFFVHTTAVKTIETVEATEEGAEGKTVVAAHMWIWCTTTKEAIPPGA